MYNLEEAQSPDFPLLPPNNDYKEITGRKDLFDDETGFLLYGLLSEEECVYRFRSLPFLCPLTDCSEAITS